MKSTQILEKIKTFLGEETSDEVLVELAQAKLENGTVLEAEAFEAGKEIFIVSEDDRVAVPVGEYMMEDGRKLIVKEEGIIGEIKAKEEEPSVKEEDRTDAAEHEEEEEKKEMKKYVKREEFDSAIEEIKDMIKELKEHKEEEKEEMSQKLSAAPASAPITHNPEVRSNTKVQFGTNRKETTLDRVMKKLTNN
jgi:flagellar biosynthesis GTPase FlhF